MKNKMFYLVLGIILGGGVYYAAKKNTNKNHISPARCALRTNMRKLWSDHVWWTRNYLISAIADTQDVKAVTDRLLKNQEDIGAAIVPYYGKEAGDKLASLLKDHILMAVDVVKAAKANQTDKLKEADTRWHKNADEIAAFLSKANAHLPEDTLKNMLYEHLKVTTEEAVARLKKEWVIDIEKFDKVYDDILKMADAITKGIAEQFPEKF